jgi:hypothetical protein
MGLDAYFRDKDGNEIKYWRKHFRLDEWMSRLAFSRGIENFDMTPIPLSLDDLAALEAHIQSVEDWDWNRWEVTDDKKQDLAAINDARRLILSNESVFYFSSA